MSTTPVVILQNHLAFHAYLEAVDDAWIVLEVMRDLPPEFEPIMELTQAIRRIIDTIRKLDLPLSDKTELLGAIGGNAQLGQS